MLNFPFLTEKLFHKPINRWKMYSRCVFVKIYVFFRCFITLIAANMPLIRKNVSTAITAEKMNVFLSRDKI